MAHYRLAGKIVKTAIGKRITSLKLDVDENRFYVNLADNSKFYLTDTGQCCCERRSMHTDDLLEHFIGAQLLNVEIADGPTTNSEYEELKECQFLRLKTDWGDITIANYNEHNGYYGGFQLEAIEVK